MVIGFRIFQKAVTETVYFFMRPSALSAIVISSRLVLRLFRVAENKVQAKLNFNKLPLQSLVDIASLFIIMR